MHVLPLEKKGMHEDVLVSPVSSTGFSRPESARGAIQTKPFIHDVNQQDVHALGHATNSMMVRRRLSGIATAKIELGDGGDRRDRTDDLKLAKLPLYQLSYVPSSLSSQAKREFPRRKPWWAWEELNFRPHAYQARALTN